MIGRVIGPYEVTASIGKGGMGEVFKAHDTKLGRDVALKILPKELAGDKERLARFEREARVLAALQHQNIAAIYGVEEADGQPVLIMELAEGQDLSLRLGQGPLAPEEVQKIALQLATGLEFAHEKGIIHRDLKPANVKVVGDGRVKILDFGLARAFSTEGGSDSASGSQAFQATMTQALTGAGTILGTAAYMSPEQARGYDVDRRSDIWAFGVILHEMMTGERLFEGATATDTLAAVLRKDADWDAVPDTMPPLLVQICQRCLVKDPQHRLRDIGEARVALEGAGASVLGLSVDSLPAMAPAPVAGGGRKLPWVLAAVFALAAAGLGYLGLTGAIGPSPEPVRLVKATISLPVATRLDLNPASPGPVKVSPNGLHLAFTASDSGGATQLYVRTLDNNVLRPIPNTRTAAYPFWSPDSRTLAFFTDAGGLERVDIAGGPVVEIARADNGKGGSWGEDGTVLYTPNHVSSIYRVSADGGTGTPVTDLQADDKVRSHRFPVWLPGGTHFVYIAVSRAAGAGKVDSILRLASIDGTVSQDLMPCQSSVVFASGHILFVHDQILMARPFDLDALAFTGPARPIGEGVLAIPAAHLSVFSAVDAGVLAYSSGGGGFGNSQLMMLDKGSGDQQLVGDPLMTYGLDLSPSGKNLVLSFPDQQNGTFDIWLLEIERNLLTRLTFEPETELAPTWSPDGEFVVFSSDLDGNMNLYRKPVVGGGQMEALFPTTNDCYADDMSPDGSLLSFTQVDTSGRSQVLLLDLETREIVRTIADPAFDIYLCNFSPDGKWVAYVSSETGSQEVFAESVTPGGGRWRVSTDGGLYPLWSRHEDRLYYLTSNGELLATEVYYNSDSLGFGRTDSVTRGVEVTNAYTYAEEPGTGRLLILKSAANRENSMLYLVTGWQRLLENNRN